jgi:hypothetical protein
VRVNGRRLQEARLQLGDELAIGPILFRFDLESEPTPEVPMKPARGVSTPAGRRSAHHGAGSKSPTAAPQPAGSDADIDLVPLDDI